jgi:thiamine-phosphate pyrophosphorylase
MVLPRLYAILDVELTRERGLDPREVSLALLDGGCALVQLRTKALGGAAFLRVAEELVAEAHSRGARIIVNDRADIARLSGADGVHVGQDDLPPTIVRRLMPAGLLGLSTHSEEQFEAGLREPVDYLAVGPVFGTGTKETGYPPRGLQFVRWAAARADRPVVAIGGITRETAPDVLAAGASSVAVISDLLAGNDPRARAKAWATI